MRHTHPLRRGRIRRSTAARRKTALTWQKAVSYETSSRSRGHQISVHALPPRELSLLGAHVDHFGRSFLNIGMNFGIDFSGGTLIELRAKDGMADTAKLRSIAEHLNVGDVEVQGFGGTSDVTLRFGLQPGGDVAQQAAVNRVRTRSAMAMRSAARRSLAPASPANLSNPARSALSFRSSRYCAISGSVSSGNSRLARSSRQCTICC